MGSTGLLTTMADEGNGKMNNAEYLAALRFRSHAQRRTSRPYIDAGTIRWAALLFCVAVWTGLFILVF